MRQIIGVGQSIIKGKFILFLTAVFLLVPTAGCAQVIASPDEQAEPLWPEQETITPAIEPNSFVNQNQGPSYGTIVMTQKPVSCNDTLIVKNHIQNTGGMAPVTFGLNLNEMGAITSLIQVYANPINKRFAIIEHFAHQKSCILTHGSDFEIILPPLPQEVPN
jgi:hypothetical protein